MKTIRSSKCSLKWTTERKREVLRSVLQEYGRVVNIFIEQFWVKCPERKELLKAVLNPVDTWLTERMKKVAAREAISMVKTAKANEWEIPVHKGKRMHVSSTIASLETPKDAAEFDGWLHLSCMGNGILLDLPIRFHKHYNKYDATPNAKRQESYIITEDTVQFSFKIQTGAKRTDGALVGVDTGITALASLSDGEQMGKDIRSLIDRRHRCKRRSKGYRRAKNALRQRMNEVAKQVVGSEPRLIVVENLRKMNHKSRSQRRVNKSMRRILGAWAYRYWLNRLERACEDNRVVYRSVPPAYTSQRCHACGHTERANRDGEVFLCRKCGFTDNADINAARNILSRFLTGPYGAGFQPQMHETITN